MFCSSSRSQRSSSSISPFRSRKHSTLESVDGRQTTPSSTASPSSRPQSKVSVSPANTVASIRPFLRLLIGRISTRRRKMLRSQSGFVVSVASDLSSVIVWV